MALFLVIRVRVRLRLGLLIFSVIENKCPFSVKSDKLDSVTGFYLEKDGEGKLTINRNHQYFYQVQTQLGVCKLESTYFVVWTENGT